MKRLLNEGRAVREAPAPGRYGRLALSLVGLCLLLYLMQAVFFLGSRWDDPYIFARYAAHLWKYGDFLWNAGEPRIEGFSSWLWLAVYIIGVRLMADPVVFARLVGLAAGAALVVSFACEMLRDRENRVAAGCGLVYLTASPALAFFAGCGMDHIAWALVAWSYLLWVGRAREITAAHMAVAALGLLVRPEGFLLFVPVLALVAAERFEGTRAERASRSLARVLLPGLALTLVLVLTRRALFGGWLPNAAAAKHAGGSILTRLIEGALYLGPGVGQYLAAPAVALALVGMGGTRFENGAAQAVRVKSRILIAAVSFTVALAAFVLVAGGDDVLFGDTRLLSPAFAPASYVLYFALRRTPPWRAALVVLVALLTRVPSAHQYLRDATGATNLSTPREIFLAWRSGLEPRPLAPLSDYLLRHTPRGEYVAIPWAGLVPYQTDLPVIDLLGLNDAHIARAPVHGRGLYIRYDADYVLKRRPYYICENFIIRGSLSHIRTLGDAELRGFGAYKDGQRELLRHPRLSAEYEIDPDAPAGTCFRRRIDAGTVSE